MHFYYKFIFMLCWDVFTQSNFFTFKACCFLSVHAFPGNWTHDLGISAMLIFYELQETMQMVSLTHLRKTHLHFFLGLHWPRVQITGSIWSDWEDVCFWRYLGEYSYSCEITKSNLENELLYTGLILDLALTEKCDWKNMMLCLSTL